MNNEAQRAAGPVEPLEPGRPDVMPNPPQVDSDIPSREGEIPLSPDDAAPLEEDMGDEAVDNTVSEERPAQG